MEVPPQDWTQCRACKADIVFAETNRMHKGKPVTMPVDVQPDPRGNVFLSMAAGKYHAGVIATNQRAGMLDAGQTLHKPHFATCPQAVRFRQHYGTGGK